MDESHKRPGYLHVRGRVPPSNVTLEQHRRECEALPQTRVDVIVNGPVVDLPIGKLSLRMSIDASLGAFRIDQVEESLIVIFGARGWSIQLLTTSPEDFDVQIASTDTRIALLERWFVFRPFLDAAHARFGIRVRGFITEALEIDIAARTTTGDELPILLACVGSLRYA